MSLDLVDFMWHPRFIMFGKEADKGILFVHKQDKNGPALILQKGPYGKQVAKGMHRSMKAMLDAGLPLIIDEFLFDDEDLPDYLTLFKDQRVYFIAVKPPVEVAEQREKARADREIGLARGLYDIVYRDYIYDLILDSSQYSPEESAHIILDYIKSHPGPQAFYSNACKKEKD